MSTKIYGGRIAHLTVDYVYTKLIKAKPHFQQLALSFLNQKILEKAMENFYFCLEGKYAHCKKFYMSPEGFNTKHIQTWKTKIKNDKRLSLSQKFNLFLRDFTSQYLDQLERYCQKQHRHELDVDFEICLYPYGSKTLMCLFTDNEVLKNEFDTLSWVKDYHYQDQTDEPCDVSKSDWKKRGKDWAKVAPGRFNDTALIFTVVKYDYIIASKLMSGDMEFGVVDRHKIAKNIFEIIEVSRQISAYNKKNPDTGIATSLCMDIMDQVHDKIKAGHKPYVEKIKAIVKQLGAIKKVKDPNFK
jgi:hypothetical protein